MNLPKRFVVAGVVVLIALTYELRTSTSGAADQGGGQSPPSFGKLLEWLAAVEGHDPGTFDAPAARVDAWSPVQLQEFFAEYEAFFDAVRGRQPRKKLTSVERADLEGWAADVAARGLSRFLKRAALLHTDVAIHVGDLRIPGQMVAPVASADSFAMFKDGRYQGLGLGAVHWGFSRELLAGVSSGDSLVPRWYHSVAALFASRHMFAEAVPHLDRARRLFPKDADILFDSGCLFESLAAPRIQDTMHATSLPGDLTYSVGSAKVNLQQAEDFFRRAVDANSAHLKARLRLGRVVDLQGRHEQAGRELRRVLNEAQDSRLQYYTWLFLGNALQELGAHDLARDAYEHAGQLFPRAQSPFLALSQLAWLDGDRPKGLDVIQSLFALPSNRSREDDPWWAYFDGPGPESESLRLQLRDLLIAGERR